MRCPPMTATLIGGLALTVALAVASAQTVASDELGRVDVGLPASYFRRTHAVFTRFRGKES